MFSQVREARYLHHEQHTDHTFLERSMYVRIHQHLRLELGHNQSILDLEERVLRCVKEEPELVQEMQLKTVSQNKDMQILHKQLLYL